MLQVVLQAARHRKHSGQWVQAYFEPEYPSTEFCAPARTAAHSKNYLLQKRQTRSRLDQGELVAIVLAREECTDQSTAIPGLSVASQSNSRYHHVFIDYRIREYRYWNIDHIIPEDEIDEICRKSAAPWIFRSRCENGMD